MLLSVRKENVPSPLAQVSFYRGFLHRTRRLYSLVPPFLLLHISVKQRIKCATGRKDSPASHTPQSRATRKAKLPRHPIPFCWITFPALSSVGRSKRRHVLSPSLLASYSRPFFGGSSRTQFHLRRITRKGIKRLDRRTINCNYRDGARSAESEAMSSS